MPEEISEFLEHFNLWKKRKNRQGQKLRITQDIWNNLKNLYQKYPDQDLKQLFSINDDMWNKKILGVAPPKRKKVIKKRNKSSDQPFLLMPETTFSKKSQGECLVLHLSLKNGVEVRIYQ